MFRRQLAFAIVASALAACASEGSGPQHKKRHATGELQGGRAHGQWTYWFDNGKKQAQGNYNADRQVGRWSYWFDDGAKEWEVGFRSEKFDGPSAWWWRGGKDRCRGFFEAGLEEGTWTHWSEDGQLAQQGDYESGRQSLAWTHWYSSGKLKAEGYQWQGERVGLWEFWDESGTPFAHTFAMPSNLKLQREEWDDGTPRREGFVSGGVPQGRWVTRHENGIRRTSGAVENGQPTGTWLAYTPDGLPLARVQFQKGKVNGGWSLWNAGVEYPRNSESLRLATFSGTWSKAADAQGQPAEQVVATWIAEAVSPLGASKDYAADAAASEPPAALLAETGKKSALPLHRQPWSDHDEENLTFLVQLYTDGAPQMTSPSGGGQYGRGMRGARKVVSQGDTQRSSPLIGRKLASGRVHTRDGAELDLDSLKGKKVVLTILRGMSGEVCVYCYSQVRALCDTMPQFRDANTAVVVVYPGESDRLEAFWQALQESEEFEARQAPFTFGYDPGFELVKSLSIVGNLALPTTLIIDAGGTIRFAYVGKDTADRPDAMRLLEQIRELKAP